MFLILRFVPSARTTFYLTFSHKDETHRFIILRISITVMSVAAPRGVDISCICMQQIEVICVGPLRYFCSRQQIDEKAHTAPPPKYV